MSKCHIVGNHMSRLNLYDCNSKLNLVDRTKATAHFISMLNSENSQMCHTFLLDNIFVQFGTKLYRQVVGIPMGTNCAPLVADLFLFCYERDFMMSLSDDKQADVIDAFNTTSRYLDDILNINNVILTIWLVKYTLQSSN